MGYKFLFLLIFSSFSLLAQNTSNESYIYRAGDDLIISDQVRTEGVTYQIEVIRLADFNPEDPEVARLQKLGKVFIESIENKKMKALMIGSFSEKEAQSILEKVKNLGFLQAKMVKYTNGLRTSTP
jgi:hypothetical protein